MPQLTDSLTARQLAVFEYIRDTILARGYGPTVREIGEHFRISSPNSVMTHLQALEKKGLLHRVRKNQRADGLAVELASGVAQESDQNKNLESLAAELFDDPQAWLDEPHPIFGGQTPRDLARDRPVGEDIVRGLLRGLKHGMSP